MSAPAPARALSLDVDGTLYRVRRLTVAWRLRADRGLLVALVAAREKIRHEGPFSDLEEIHLREAELVAPSFDLTVADANARLSGLRDSLAEALTARIRPYPGVRGALEAAHARGLRLGVLSDYEAQEKLDNLGLGDLPWACQVSAEAVGALKPHRRPYEQLAAGLGVPPETIVHVGDREDVDVAGAQAAGLRAWRFSPRKRTPSRAERVFDKWTLDVFSPLWSGADGPIA